MKGIQLSKYTANLSKYYGNNMLEDSFKNISKSKTILKYIDSYGWKNINDAYLKIPFKIFNTECSFDDICKIFYASPIMMDIHNHFERNYQYEIIRKLKNSMWRWEFADKSPQNWNIIVDAYNSIRSVKVDGFDITLDYTTYCNEKGYSKFSRTYLDGIFAFLIHYKGKHVMTIGFTILSNYKILLNQIQLVNKKGNRFLYKIKKNRIEWAIDLFHTFFKPFSLYLINGKDLAECIKQQYQCLLNESTENLQNAKKSYALNPKDSHNLWRLEYYSKIKKEYTKKIRTFKVFTFNHIINTYGANLKDYKRYRGLTKLKLRFNLIKRIKND